MPSKTEAGARLVSFRDVDVGYGGTPVLTDLTFDVTRGDFLGFVGPNGSGKTTILRVVLGMLRPISGRVTFHDPSVRFGYVPQRQAMEYGWPLTALEVTAMGLYDRLGVFRRVGAREEEASLDALGHVGIRDLHGASFSSLSGGQKQRVLIARALVGRPSVLVLDEPTDGMDLASAASILELVRELHDEGGLTVLMVSHQLNEVAAYVHRLALVVEGGFRIGPVNSVLTPPNLSRMYGVPVEVDDVGGRRLVFAADP